MVLCSFVITAQAGDSGTDPMIQSNRVVFSNGKELSFENYRVVHKNPLEAQKKKEPVIVRQKPVLVKEWRRLLLIETQELYEDELKMISIYDYAGSLRGNSQLFFGKVLVLENAGRILLAQQSAHHSVRTSTILDTNGETLFEISLPPNVFRYEVTIDKKLVWILSSHLSKGRPYVKAMLVNLEGKTVGELDTFDEKEIGFNYGEKLYTIRVPAPQPPG